MNVFRKILPSLALVALSLVSCEKDKERPGRVFPLEPKAVEIPVSPMGSTIGVDVGGMGDGPQTRALGPLTGLGQNEVYMAYGESPPGPYRANPNYTKALKGLITYGITVFQPLLFYPIYAEDAYTNIYMRGFYPREGVTDFNGHNSEMREIIANRVHYEIDGSHDILLSSMVKGNYDDAIWRQYNSSTNSIKENAILRYTHLLSRIRFQVARSATWTQQIRLVHLYLTGISTKATLDLTKESTDPEVLVFESAHDKTIDVYKYDGPNTGLAAGMTLGTSYNWVGSPASPAAWEYFFMIEAYADFQLKAVFSTGDTINIDRITRRTRTINIKGDDPPPPVPNTYHDFDIIQPNYQYDVRINFTNLGVTATAEMEPWNENTKVGDGGQTGWW